MKLIIMTALYAAISATALALLHGTLNRSAVSGRRRSVLRTVLPCICAVMWVFPLAGALIPDSPICWFFQRWGNIFLGFLLYFFWPLLLIWLLWLLPRTACEKRRGIRKLPGRFFSWLLILLCVISCCVNVLGYATAHDIKVTRYEVPKDALGIDRSLRIVLISDLHIGVNSSPKLYADMAARINEQDADLVLVAGDVLTSSFGAMGDPETWSSVLSGIRSRFGTYVVYGNHDVDEPLLGGFTYVGAENAHRHPEMPGFLESCGWTLLQDEVVCFPELDGLCVAGRLDESRPGDGVEHRAPLAALLADTDPASPILLLEHEPADLQVMGSLGVDLAVSGHTHDGQIFPGNLITRAFAAQAYGMKQWDGTRSVVTSGVGYFGPPIRVGTISEIAVIDIG